MKRFILTTMLTFTVASQAQAWNPAVGISKKAATRVVSHGWDRYLPVTVSELGSSTTYTSHSRPDCFVEGRSRYNDNDVLLSNPWACYTTVYGYSGSAGKVSCDMATLVGWSGSRKRGHYTYRPQRGHDATECRLR